jgi:hypothetical protein
LAPGWPCSSDDSQALHHLERGLTSCISAALPFRLYAAADGLLPHNTTIDAASGDGLASLRGSRASLVSDQSALRGASSEADKAELLTNRVRTLFGALQESAEDLSSDDGRQFIKRSGASSPRNQSAPAAEFGPDGHIAVTGNAIAWADALERDNGGNLSRAMYQAQAGSAEELWHVAQLVAMRNDWLKAGRPGGYDAWVAAESRRMICSFPSPSKSQAAA